MTLESLTSPVSDRLFLFVSSTTRPLSDVTGLRPKSCPPTMAFVPVTVTVRAAVAGAVCTKPTGSC
ncbi:MAG: hypothetical protein ACK58L_20285, partial [Planctomycetota bacterium]